MERELRKKLRRLYIFTSDWNWIFARINTTHRGQNIAVWMAWVFMREHRLQPPHQHGRYVNIYDGKPFFQCLIHEWLICTHHTRLWKMEFSFHSALPWLKLHRKSRNSAMWSELWSFKRGRLCVEIGLRSIFPTEIPGVKILQRLCIRFLITIDWKIDQCSPIPLRAII